MHPWLEIVILPASRLLVNVNHPRFGNPGENPGENLPRNAELLQKERKSLVTIVTVCGKARVEQHRVRNVVSFQVAKCLLENFLQFLFLQELDFLFTLLPRLHPPDSPRLVRADGRPAQGGLPYIPERDVDVV